MGIASGRLVSLALVVGICATPVLADEIVAWDKNDNYGLRSGAPTGEDFVDVDAGMYHALALRSDGTLAAWGNNWYGQVGKTPSGSDFEAIAAGHFTSLAIDSDGYLTVWGLNSYRLVSRAPSGSGFTAAAIGMINGVALHSDGTVTVWGNNAYGQVSGSPTDKDFVAVACTDSGTIFALDSDGGITAWGRNAYSAKSAVPDDDDYAAIDGNGYSGIALTVDGGLELWGQKDKLGSLPTGTFEDVDLGNLWCAAAIRSDGSLAQWGDGKHLSLYLGSPPSGKGFTAVAMAQYTGIALRQTNGAPTVSVTGGGTYELGTNVFLEGTVADDDGDVLDWEWMEWGAVSALASGTVNATASGVDLPTTTVATSDLGLGSTDLVLTVDDGDADPVAGKVTVKVVDTTSPALSASCGTTRLWPPNHRMVTVKIATTSSDLSGAVELTVSAASDESDNAKGSGRTAPDIRNLSVDQSTGVVTVDLRAERSGKGNGRTYTITITATDSSGNSTSRLCEVLVPKSRKK